MIPQDFVDQLLSRVDLVEVYATVTDASGGPVSGLRAQDFEILENGQRLLDHREHLLDLLGVLAGRRELHVFLERGLGLGQLALIDEAHAEPVPRVGHLRIELGGLLELDLGLRGLALVPQDDALVEDRTRVAATTRGLRDLVGLRAFLGRERVPRDGA